MQTRLNIDQRKSERGYIFKHNGNGGNLKKINKRSKYINTKFNFVKDYIKERIMSNNGLFIERTTS